MFFLKCIIRKYMIKSVFLWSFRLVPYSVTHAHCRLPYKVIINRCVGRSVQIFLCCSYRHHVCTWVSECKHASLYSNNNLLEILRQLQSYKPFLLWCYYIMGHSHSVQGEEIAAMYLQMACIHGTAWASLVYTNIHMAYSNVCPHVWNSNVYIWTFLKYLKRTGILLNSLWIPKQGIIHLAQWFLSMCNWNSQLQIHRIYWGKKCYRDVRLLLRPFITPIEILLFDYSE